MKPRCVLLILPLLFIACEGHSPVEPSLPPAPTPVVRHTADVPPPPPMSTVREWGPPCGQAWSATDMADYETYDPHRPCAETR